MTKQEDKTSENEGELDRYIVGITPFSGQSNKKNQRKSHGATSTLVLNNNFDVSG